MRATFALACGPPQIGPLPADRPRRVGFKEARRVLALVDAILNLKLPSELRPSKPQSRDDA